MRARSNPSANCHVRYLIRRDIGQTLAILQKASCYAYSPKRLCRLISSREETAFVAEHNTTGRIAGFLLFESNMIADLCVSKTAQGRDVGSRLISESRRILLRSKPDFKYVDMYVSERAWEMQVFLHQQHGFNRVRGADMPHGEVFSWPPQDEEDVAYLMSDRPIVPPVPSAEQLIATANRITSFLGSGDLY